MKHGSGCALTAGALFDILFTALDINYEHFEKFVAIFAH